MSLSDLNDVSWGVSKPPEKFVDLDQSRTSREDGERRNEKFWENIMNIEIPYDEFQM